MLDIYEQAHNLDYYEGFQDDKKHRSDKVLSAILRALKELEITLNNDEREWLKERCKDVYKSLDKGEKTHSYSHKYTINLLVDSLGYLLTQGEGNHKSKMIKNREYYPLIHLPREMRCLIPLKYLSIDLVSANPQIVDSMIGSHIGLEVYGNLMENRGITRLEAKKLYNTYLNRHYLSLGEGVEFYLECGYTQDEAEKLAKLTTNVKRGGFYERMTENEQVLMENYNHILMAPSHRFHDALIVKLEAVEGNHMGLPSIVEGYKYHFNLFNDGSDYDGLIL